MKILLLIGILAMGILRGVKTPVVDKPASIPAPATTVERIPENEQDRLLYFAKKFTYVRETNGYNRSPEIDKWNLYAGGSLGDPYCSSFVSYIYYLAKIKGPRSAWSPDQVSSHNVKFGDVQGGDAFGLYFSSKGRVAHTGYVVGVSGSTVRTLEANTSGDAVSGSAKDREGDGVFCKTRSKFLMANSKNKFSRYWK